MAELQRPHPGPYVIPELTNKRLKELLAKIRPVVTRDGVKHFIKKCHPRDVAFTWDPKLAALAPGLEPLCEVRTLHRYGYYGLFKPSLAECLAFLPPSAEAEAVAFEIVDRPGDAADLNAESGALNAGCHVATTVFYRQGKS